MGPRTRLKSASMVSGVRREMKRDEMCVSSDGRRGGWRDRGRQRVGRARVFVVAHQSESDAGAVKRLSNIDDEFVNMFPSEIIETSRHGFPPWWDGDVPSRSFPL